MYLNMLNHFLIGTLSGILFLLGKNIIEYDIFGLELEVIRSVRSVQEETDVQATSRMVSAWRAMDAMRENSGYKQDPLARVLAGDDLITSLTQEMSESFRSPAENELHSVTLRQLAINDRIMNYCSNDNKNDDHVSYERVIQQVVVLGAGLDTRPYRLSLPEIRWFEIDMPEVVSMKEAKLREEETTLAVKECLRLPLNLVESMNSVKDIKFSLSSSGHNASQPTLFIMEGLVMYISPSAIRTLMDGIAHIAAPGSRVIMSQISLKYHYLLTNPIVIFVIEKFSKFKSHQIAKLFKSNLFTTHLGSFWTCQRTSNIGHEMFVRRGLVQWQPIHHVLGTAPKVVYTAESILDIIRIND